MRRAAKRDSNERDIIDALRRAGASVHQLSDKGLPDLLVGYRGHNLLLEIKDRRGQLTPDQREWFTQWRGQRAVARTVHAALRLLHHHHEDPNTWPV